MSRVEESPSAFEAYFRADAPVIQLGFALKEDNDANVDEALDAICKVRRGLIVDICNLKYWFIRSSSDFVEALKMKHYYTGRVIMEDKSLMFAFRHGACIPAFTRNEAEALFGVEVIAEAAAEMEAISRKYKDKLKEAELFCEKFKEAERQPEGIKKKLIRAEAEIKSLKDELKGVPGKHGRAMNVSWIEECSSAFKAYVLSEDLIFELEMALKVENDDASIKEALEAITKVRRGLLYDICHLKYWFIQSSFDYVEAREMKHYYTGRVIMEDKSLMFHFEGVAFTRNEAEARYGVETIAEAAAEMEAISHKYKDKLKEAGEFCEKLKEAERQPEGIRKKLERAEAKVRALKEELIEAEAKHQRRGNSKKRKLFVDYYSS